MCGKMGFKSSSLLYLALFFAVSSSIHAFNITKLLGHYPEYSTFNNYITETKLVGPINRRNTITVLVVNNSAISSISGNAPQVLKAIMGTHVLLDYFDEQKLKQGETKGRWLTTLFQASGLAVSNQGHLKFKVTLEGKIVFGSAQNGSSIDDELVKSVVNQPYNISILEIAKPIVPSGLSESLPPPSDDQDAKAPEASAKAPTKGGEADAPAADEEIAPSPPEVITDSPSEAPAPGPEADASSPAPAPGPSDDEDAADAEPKHSSSSRTVVGLVGAVMCFASLLVVM